MAYSHKSQFPRVYTKITDVVAAAQPIFAAGTPVAISHIVIANGSAVTQVVIFRTIADVEICRVVLLTMTSIVIPGWRVDTGGLEVFGTAGTGCHVTVFYVTHTQGV
jgi:hypothetical protein